MHKIYIILWFILKKLPNKSIVFKLRLNYLKNICGFKIGNGVKIGKNLNFHNNINISIGNNVLIKNNLIIKKEGPRKTSNLEIKDGCLIMENVFFDCSDDLTVEKDSHIGRRVSIYTHSHDYQNNTLPPAKQAIKTSPVLLGKNTILYEEVIIMPGISLPNFSVVGIRSIVTKTFKEEGSVIAGIPAKLIGSRLG